MSGMGAGSSQFSRPLPLFADHLHLHHAPYRRSHTRSNFRCTGVSLARLAKKRPRLPSELPNAITKSLSGFHAELRLISFQDTTSNFLFRNDLFRSHPAVTVTKKRVRSRAQSIPLQFLIRSHFLKSQQKDEYARTE